VVTLQFPDKQDFSGKTLEEALAWCLVWLMASGLGSGHFGSPCPAACAHVWQQHRLSTNRWRPADGQLASTISSYAA
jgi:hypothetical protein